MGNGRRSGTLHLEKLMRHVKLAWPALCLSALLVSCEPSTTGNDALPLNAVDSRSFHTAPAAELQRAAGVDRLPRIARGQNLKEVLQRHYPAALGTAGIGKAVVVDVTIDADGSVTQVNAAQVSSEAGRQVVLVSDDASTNERSEALLSKTDHHPALARAAEAALRDIKFTPATRDGVAVPHSFRMTLAF